MQPNEAEIFSDYLIGKKPSSELAERYFTAAAKITETNERNIRIEKLALRRSSLLPFLDAALAVSDRNALLRRKLLVMLAILETTPEYYHKFNSKNESLWKWAAILLRGCVGIFKMLVGKIILLFV